MKNELKQISCEPDCGFMVRSHEENELIKIAKEHAKIIHKINPTTDELKEKMVSV